MGVGRGGGQCVGNGAIVIASNPGFPFRILSRSFEEKQIFLQSCKTKSGTESLGSRLLQVYRKQSGWSGLGRTNFQSSVGVVICYRPARCAHLEQLQNVKQMQQAS